MFSGIQMRLVVGYNADSAMGVEKKMNLEPLTAFAFGLGVYELIILAGIGLALMTTVVAIVVFMIARRR